MDKHIEFFITKKHEFYHIFPSIILLYFSLNPSIPEIKIQRQNMLYQNENRE